MTPSQLVEHFGSVTATANALGVKPPSVSEWIANDVVPLGRQCQAEVVTGGKLKADRKALGPLQQSASPVRRRQMS